MGGVQDFSKLREGNFFYIDKTAFILEWWSEEQAIDDVSLILCLRRFGKTLLLSTVERFSPPDTPIEQISLKALTCEKIWTFAPCKVPGL